jgi:hypothetical protein
MAIAPLTTLFSGGKKSADCFNACMNVHEISGRVLESFDLVVEEKNGARGRSLFRGWGTLGPRAFGGFNLALEGGTLRQRSTIEMQKRIHQVLRSFGAVHRL